MAVRLPPMQALRAFEAAARMQSLTKAAQSLNLTHGAISHQIKSLEGDLGVRLIERAGRGIRLTDEGERFARRVRDGVRRARRGSQRDRRAREPATVAGERRAVVRRALAAAADRTIRRGAIPTSISTSAPTARTSTSARRRSGHGDPLRVRRMAGRRRRAPARRPVLSRCAARGIANGRLPQRPADLADYPLLRSDDELWKPWFEAAGLDWPEPDARTDVQRLGAHASRRRRKDRALRWHAARCSATTCATASSFGSSTSTLPSARKYYLVYPRADGELREARAVPRSGCTMRSSRTGSSRYPAGARKARSAQRSKRR